MSQCSLQAKYNGPLNSFVCDVHVVFVWHVFLVLHVYSTEMYRTHVCFVAFSACSEWSF